MIVHHDSGQRTLERRGYSSRPVGSCGTICTSVTTDASKITCRRRACAKHAAKVEQPRRIALVIAPATDTRCATGWGKESRCPHLNPGEPGSAVRCEHFKKPLRFEFSQLPERLPECRAAEVEQ